MKSILKSLSAIAASTLLFCSASVCASANTTPSLTPEKLAVPSGMGFSEAQINNIASTNIIPNQYIAYFNLPSDIIIPPPVNGIGNTFSVSARHIATGVTYDGFQRGIGVSQAAYTTNIVEDPVTLDGIDYKVTVIFNYFSHTDESFPNIIRFKYTGNPTPLILNCFSEYNNSYIQDNLTKGYVEAGNITKYITDSTDTASVINDDDAYRLFYHAARLVAELPDPDWTDEATVAGDLNFDNQITAADSQILYNALANETDLW